MQARSPIHIGDSAAKKHRRSGDCPLRQSGPRILISGPPYRKIMSSIRNICVYCGSGPGADPAFAEAARALGTILAKNSIGLVYGGGSIGLMGELANAVLDNGGKATGVIPTFLV